LGRIADRLLGELAAAGAVLKLAPEGLQATLTEGLAPLLARGVLGEDLRPTSTGAAVLAFYASSVQQRLGLDSVGIAATQRT
jgi:glycerol-3-phosphate O-acyltransferase